MPETQEDVNAVNPSTTEQAVQEPVEETTAQDTAPEEQETPQQAESATPEAVTQEGEVDERGVPYKNRFFEYKRKYTELETNLPNMIQQAVREAIPHAPQQPQEPRYTEEQLIQFKNETDDARSRAWAEMELRKIDDRKQETKFRTIVEERDTRQRLEQEANNAFQTVRSKYSVAFNPDGTPNMSHPLTQRTVQIYNSDPMLKRDSRGLLKAADMAFADFALQQAPHLAQQQKQLKRQVRKLEKTTLTEGGGTPVSPAPKSGLNTAKENLRQTGSTQGGKIAVDSRSHEKALRETLKEYFKARGTKR